MSRLAPSPSTVRKLHSVGHSTLRPPVVGPERARPLCPVCLAVCLCPGFSPLSKPVDEWQRLVLCFVPSLLCCPSARPRALLLQPLNPKLLLLLRAPRSVQGAIAAALAARSPLPSAASRLADARWPGQARSRQSRRGETPLVLGRGRRAAGGWSMEIGARFCIWLLFEQLSLDTPGDPDNSQGADPSSGRPGQARTRERPAGTSQEGERAKGGTRKKGYLVGGQKS
jgi:hypothetical protein